MNSEFFDALNSLEKEKGISGTYLIEKISTAIAIAIKRDMGGSDNTIVEIDPMNRRFYVAVRKTIVEDVKDTETEITVSDATKYTKSPALGAVVEIPLETKKFGRIAAQSAKHVIRQGISEAEKGQLVKKYQDKKFEILSAPILKVDEVKGNVTIEIDKSEAILPKSEQVPGEILKEGQRIMVYVVDVMTSGKNPKLMISRSHPGLIKRLFELHTPEIKDGTVEIKSVSREAGSRTKMAVWSKDENVDAVGACIGPRGSRVTAIVEELGGEKIDVIKYSEKPEELIAAALSPADVVTVIIDPSGTRSCKAIVADNQLSLAIGNKGQNVRLAARLTGWKIDIGPESQAKEIIEEMNRRQEEHNKTLEKAVDNILEDKPTEEIFAKPQKTTDETEPEKYSFGGFGFINEIENFNSRFEIGPEDILPSIIDRERELKNLGEMDDLDESDDLDELKELDDLEELDESDDLDELDSLEDFQESDDLDDLGLVENLEDSDDLDELGLVESLEDSDDLNELGLVERLEDSDDLDEFDPAEDFEDLEESDD